MKKKTYIIISLVIVLLLGAICIGIFNNRPVENSMPYMIMVDGQIYQLNDSAQEIPEDAIEGYITKIVPGSEKPNENQAANFGEIGKQYWMSDNKIYIWAINEYDIFVPTED
jgi:hypothetical protein